MLLSKTVLLKQNTYMKRYYEEKGYPFIKRGCIMEVKIEDLPDTSNAIVDVLCDFCGKHYTMKYCKYLSTKDSGNCCFDCRYEKTKKNNLIKYGVENTSELSEVQEKRRKTCLERYGAVSNLCLDSVKEKIRATCLEKYGVEYALQNDEIKQKIKETNLEKYGFENPMKNDFIKNKVRNSLYQNESCPSSKAQRHLCKLYNGILNYPIGNYNLDILLDNKIYIEYSGGGHNLCVCSGKITQQKFEEREIKRFNYLKNMGYKMILYINKTDKLPDDEYMIKLLDYCIKYLNDSNNYKIEINLDNEKIEI